MRERGGGRSALVEAAFRALGAQASDTEGSPTHDGPWSIRHWCPNISASHPFGFPLALQTSHTPPPPTFRLPSLHLPSTHLPPTFYSPSTLPTGTATSSPRRRRTRRSCCWRPPRRLPRSRRRPRPPRRPSCPPAAPRGGRRAQGLPLLLLLPRRRPLLLLPIWARPTQPGSDAGG